MRYNGKCTIWHKTDDGYTTLHYPCWWQDTEAVNISKSGSTNVDTALIHLPVDAEISKADYIALGDIEYIVENPTELLKAYKPLKITTVSRKTYGSRFMHHTEVTAK